MFFGNNDSKLEGTLQWISTDQKVVVKEIDYYVSWTESYLDKDGLPKTANHGKKKLSSLAQAGPARTAIPFAFTANDVYEIFKNATFDYDDGVGSRNVFTNPKDGDRSASSYFTSNDKFVFSWGFKAEDGRYFDTWSGGICSNSVGANCFLNFNIVCVSELAGTYDYSTVGWCGDVKAGTLEIKVKGTGTYEFFLDGGTDPDFSLGSYEACYGAGSTLPGGSLLLNDSCNKLFFSGTSRWGEVYTFNSITVNGGTLILDWKNDYDPEAAVTTITRKDGKDWPALKK
ncbi:MAG: hypothetical protein IPM42_04790 [Saprospiraceae bacterium]|nr:hypothetical protein [Saprospiraceae bacterium]